MTDRPPVARALDELHLPYRLFVHAGPVHSLEQTARERQQLPDQVMRSIVFRVGKDEFLMALMAGDRQISWSALRRYLGQSRLTLAVKVIVQIEEVMATLNPEESMIFGAIESIVLVPFQLLRHAQRLIAAERPIFPTLVKTSLA